jgi:glucosamine--fructose-6-phosphate aminotransferase (isomerizing)
MICSHCVLPDNYPGITFDTNGVCSLCREHKKLKYLGVEALERYLKAVARGTGPYDCVVPVSGGKDSTYVLYYLTTVLGLKTIAVNYDNGFTHMQAKDNLRRVTETLGVELVTIKGFNQKKNLAGNLRSFLARPTPAMVPMMCTGCRVGIVCSACKVARDRGVNVIVMGWSPIEDTPFKAAFLTADGGSVVKGLAKNVVLNPRYSLYGGVFTQIMDFLHSYSRVREWGTILQALHPGIRQISFFNYVEYYPERIQQEVTEKVGWSSPDPENSWQFDCRIKSLQNCLYRTAIGFTASNDYLSAKIREGYITREQALKLLEKQKENAHAELEYVLAMLSEVGVADLVPRFKKMVSISRTFTSARKEVTESM